MRINSKIRILLTILLAVASAVILLNFLRTIGGLINFDPLYILSALGSVSLLIFISISAEDLIKNKLISKEAFVMSVTLSTVTFLILAWLGFGLLQDALGVRCSGFFGSSASCTLSPLLIVAVLVLQPTVLALSGLAAIFGTYAQLNARNANK